jgi:hypothetical protein
MKKILALTALMISFPVSAQGIIPAQSASNAVATIKVQPAQTKSEAEVQGYSVAFLAYHYNDVCKLKLDKTIMDNLLSELSQAEKANEIAQADINKTLDDIKKVYAENPEKFCSDAMQVANAIKDLFGKK